MKHAARCALVLLALGLLAAAVAACASAPTAAPTDVPPAAPTAAPVANPTTAPAAKPTTAPVAEPTAAPVASPAATKVLPTYAPPPTVATGGAPVATPDVYIEGILLSPTDAAGTTSAKTPASGGYSLPPASPPSSPETVQRISIDDLKALMDGKAKIAVLDTRPKASYDLGHIKGAVCFPWKPTLRMEDAAALPVNTPLVTYCSCGPGEADSASVAFQLYQLGWSDVRVLSDPSVDGWIAAGYPSE